MEYRIKLTENYCGDKTYIPQYRNEGWMIELGCKILFSWLMFFLWLLVYSDKKWKDISEYFEMWHSIEWRKYLFEGNSSLFMNNSETAICSSKESAEQIIKMHKEDAEKTLLKKEFTATKVQMNKTKKTVYIKIK